METVGTSANVSLRKYFVSEFRGFFHIDSKIGDFIVSEIDIQFKPVPGNLHYIPPKYRRDYRAEGLSQVAAR